MTNAMAAAMSAPIHMPAHIDQPSLVKSRAEV